MGYIIDKQHGTVTRTPTARAVYTFTFRMLRCADADALPVSLFSESGLIDALNSWYERHDRRAWFLRAAERGQINAAERAALESYRCTV